MTKDCNHLWNKDPDRETYHCCICGETRTTTPPELIKQTTFDTPGGDKM